MTTGSDPVVTRPVGRATGHYAGAVSRLAAFVIDWFTMVTVYSLLLAGLSWLLDLVSRIEWDLTEGAPIGELLGFVVWAFLYQTISITISGRTPGKAIVGLRIVTRDGDPVSGRQAVVRTIALPLSFALFGIGLLGILLGKEHRALHDAIAGTAVVYDWGDRYAELPAPLTRYLERQGVAVVPRTAPPAEPT